MWCFNQLIINRKLLLSCFFHPCSCGFKKQINEPTKTLSPELGILIVLFLSFRLSAKLALFLPELPSCFRVPFVSLRWNFDALTERKALPAQGLRHTRTLGSLWASHQDVAACVYCFCLWLWLSFPEASWAVAGVLRPGRGRLKRGRWADTADRLSFRTTLIHITCFLVLLHSFVLR